MQDGSEQQEGAIAAVQEGRGQQIRRMIIAKKAKKSRELQRLEEASTGETAQVLKAVEEEDGREAKEREERRRTFFDGVENR